MSEQNTIERIKRQTEQNPGLLYMKGTPQFPQCGFSAQVVQILKRLNANYGYVNILENPDIRSVLPKVANWPTFPQFYIKGELIGGCDILTELYEEGELQKMVETAGLVAPEVKTQVAVE